MHQSAEQWRQKYWDDFYTGISIKLVDWAYEKEHRLLLSSTIFDFKEPHTRKLKYNFCDLEGIIFGIKTPEKEKKIIMNIIEEKCRLDNRQDFKFYQAYYSRVSGKVKAAEMDLLKF